MHQAFRYELDPNDRQRTHLAQHAGCARFTYNWGLARRKADFARTGRSPDAVELHRELNRLKASEFPWMYALSKCAPQEALRDLDVAYERFFAEVKAARAEKRRRRVYAPRFKKKGKSRDSFRLTGSISVGERWVRLPRLGRLRLKESSSKLRGKILCASVSREADRWYVSLRVECSRPEPEHREGAAVGVDLGLQSFAAISDEKQPVLGPKALDAGLRKQRRLSRLLSRRQKGSANRKKAAMRLARHHRKVANIRKDFLHKLSTRLGLVFAPLPGAPDRRLGLGRVQAPAGVQSTLVWVPVAIGPAFSQLQDLLRVRCGQAGSELVGAHLCLLELRAEDGS